jgi:hypothetical protein
VYYEHILKYLALKLIRRNHTYIEAYIDEVAQAGVEARGQGSSEESALTSYLFTLSRKVNVNAWLASQLLSMFDKRIQWIGDWYILCEAKPDPLTPVYFSYKVYDSYDNKRNEFKIAYGTAKELIFKPRLFRTEEVPFEQTLLDAYTEMYKVTARDLTRFDRIMEMEKVG